MSGYLLLLACTAFFCLANADHDPVHLGNEEFLLKQKKVYELLWEVDQAATSNPELYAQRNSFDIRANIQSYKNESDVEDFLKIYDHGMLPRGRLFSIFYPALLDEAIALFRVFYSARDFETFYKTAIWARAHINEGQFIYAFSVAVVHRPDTKYIRLPPLFEIYPNYFFNYDVIRKADLERMNHSPSPGHETVHHTILANHSLWYTRRSGDPEHKLNYFTDDVGLNAYYSILHLEFPFWMSSDEYNLPKGSRGEQYLHSLKLILTRYNLERISNELNEIEWIDWNKPIPVGYHPFMLYSNGQLFPHRHDHSMVPPHKYKKLEKIQHLESRVLEIIESGYIVNSAGKTESIYTPEGLNILGNIIEGNADSPNRHLYGSLDQVSRDVLGFNPEPLSKHRVLPSAIQHFATSMRDPVFYRLCNRIISYLHEYKRKLPPYSPEELGHSSGLRIESVVVDKLETYFDFFDSVVYTNDQISLNILARQYRLNHKPFTYRINVNAAKETKAIVRFFLGPKYNDFSEELDISEIYENFYEFDMLKVDLKPGNNEIKRSSHEALFVSPDEDSMDIYWNKIKNAIGKLEPLTYSEHVYGFPQRLLLPKGRKDGLRLQIFVHIVPVTDDKITEIDSRIWGKAYVDSQAMGYPLDRPIIGYNSTLPNMYFQDVVVFHKETREINATV